MPGTMQERAFRSTRAFLDANCHDKRPNPTRLAMCLKKVREEVSKTKLLRDQEFDGAYGLAWHCIAGKSFGSFVTHANGGFVYFSVDNLCFPLFKTEVRPLIKPKPPRLGVCNGLVCTEPHRTTLLLRPDRTRPSKMRSGPRSS
ncbi:unnamed protein product [Linum tenue]|uniref:Dynein light chain n=1 Tax=Linum tenue TaxID=586396 RepID=A0AAV0H9P9_9ROSI|nr:unnamed protein product [Linum tenue]